MASLSGNSKQNLNIGSPLTERQLEVLNKQNWLDDSIILIKLMF